MPVPSSYNEIPNSKQIRDFVGWAWYDREFYVDNTWTQERVVLRLDSAHYNAIVVSTISAHYNAIVVSTFSAHYNVIVVNTISAHYNVIVVSTISAHYNAIVVSTISERLTTKLSVDSEFWKLNLFVCVTFFEAILEHGSCIIKRSCLLRLL